METTLGTIILASSHATHSFSFFLIFNNFSKVVSQPNPTQVVGVPKLEVVGAPNLPTNKKYI